MIRLPRHHLSRPRLLQLASDSPVVLVEAGAGYGKSVLAAELATDLGVVVVDTTLGPNPISAGLLGGRLIAATRRIGLSDAATQMTRAGADAAGAVDALVDSLRGERVLVLVDEAQCAEPDAAALLLRLAANLGQGHRLAVVGRHLPEGAQRLRRRGDVARIDIADLAFKATEVVDLYRAGFGLDIEDHVAAALCQGTGGWAAALVLGASRALASRESEQDLAELVGRGPTSILNELAREILADLSPSTRSALLQVSHLPFLDEELATRVSGATDLFQEAAAAGIAFTLRQDGWWEIPGALREVLARMEPPDPVTFERASQAYVARGELASAVSLLMAAGHANDAAAVLAHLSYQQVSQLDLLALGSVVEALPRPALAANPRLLLHLARACEPAAEIRRRSKALSDAARSVDPDQEPALSREIDAEYARDLVRDERIEVAGALATELLGRLGPDEEATRARLLDVLGQVAAWTRDEGQLRVAEQQLTAAARLYRQLQQFTSMAQAMLALSMLIHYERGEYDAATRRLDEALAVLPARTRLRAVVLTFRADVLLDRGLFEEAEANLNEARELATFFGDHRAHAYADCGAIRLASQRGEVDAPLGTSSARRTPRRGLVRLLRPPVPGRRRRLLGSSRPDRLGMGIPRTSQSCDNRGGPHQCG